jgi:hypothetical protein
MARSFNTTGPGIPSEHYMLAPEERLYWRTYEREGRVVRVVGL